MKNIYLVENILQFKGISQIICTAQKMKLSIKDFFSKCDQIRRKLGIWSHLLKKFLTENFIFGAVLCPFCGVEDTRRHEFQFTLNELIFRA